MKEHFPFFIPSSNKKVLIFGGGHIALRRIKTLMKFNFEIKIVSPTLCDELQELVILNKIDYFKGIYEKRYITDQFVILACTDSRQVNKQIGIDSKEHNIYVSVCDNFEECTIYFPAIINDTTITVGVVGNGKDHKKVKNVADKIRNIINKDEDICI